MPPFLGAVLDFIFGRSVVVERIIQNATVHDAEMARLRKEVEAANNDRDEMLRKHNELSVESEQMRNRWAQNERQLQDFKATHDMQLEENKRSFERMTIE